MLTAEIQARELALCGGPKAVTDRLPAWPYVSDDEIQAVVQTLLKGRTEFASMCSAGKGGPGQALEERMQRELGVPFAIATAGGGPALHIACMCALQMGDEAIVTPYSWGQSVACVLQAGGVPIFADIDPQTLTLDPKSIARKITPRTKAIVVVHIGGVPADMDAIMTLARQHGLAVIEDCAQAQGSLYRGQQVGTLGDFGCFSLGSGKNIAAGEAGVLVVKTREHYERAILLGMHPARANADIQDPELKKSIDSLIYTYRVNAISAALAVKQFDRLPEMNRWRRENLRRLAEKLEGIPGIRPIQVPGDREVAWHMGLWTFVPEEVGNITREQFLKALTAEGVPIVGSYVRVPIHLRPVFQKKQTHLGRGFPWAAHPAGEKIVYKAGDCPVAERRCATQDLVMFGGACWKDCSPLIGQIAAAFRKVTAQIDKIKAL